MDEESDQDEAQREILEATFDQLKDIQVKRNQLEQWVDEPFFNRCILDCVVRMSAELAPHSLNYKAHNHKVMGLIKEVTQGGKSYRFGPKQLETRKYLSVDFGNGSPKPIEMIVVSNEDITDPEFLEFHRNID